MKSIFLFALTAVLLVRCTVGPEYKQPAVVLPQNWGETVQLVDAKSAVDWWQVYGDDALVQLVERGLDANFDVRMEQARIREARASLAAARGEKWPTLNAAASFQRAKASENGQEPAATFFEQGLASPYQNAYQTGFDASWEWDLFGRLQRGVQGAEARFEAAVAGVAQTRLTLAAEVARLYFTDRGLKRRQAIIERRVALRREVAKLVQVRRDAGLASALEVAQSEALVAQAEAVLPQLIAEQEAVAQALSLLLDRDVHELRSSLAAAKQAQLPQSVALNTPAALLQRRPDIVIAERQLAAATADIGVAEGHLWPRISLAAAFGLEAQSAGDLFDSGSFQGLITPRISIPIFNRNQIRAGIEASEARENAALAAYEKAVKQALSDVGTAIARFEGQRATHRKLNEAEAKGSRALDLAQVLYEKGLEDLLLVLDSERTLTEIQEGRIQAETQAYLSSVTLYKALGGGWQL